MLGRNCACESRERAVPARVRELSVRGRPGRKSGSRESQQLRVPRLHSECQTRTKTGTVKSARVAGFLGGGAIPKKRAVPLRLNARTAHGNSAKGKLRIPLTVPKSQTPARTGTGKSARAAERSLRVCDLNFQNIERMGRTQLTWHPCITNPVANEAVT